MPPLELLLLLFFFFLLSHSRKILYTKFWSKSRHRCGCWRHCCDISTFFSK